MKKIVDFFPYFDPTGKEILELRVNMLKDYVDEFVICESNKTQSGIPIEYNLRKRIEEFNLPKEKIRIIDLDIPEDSDLIIEDIDRYNCSENYDFDSNINQKNLNSLRGRVRERMQKDSLLLVLDEYDDDTVFIHSDSDEIVKPETIEWISHMCRENPEFIIKIPLVYLEGRADLRVYLKNENVPKPWDGGMFFATKKQLKIVTPIQIRSCIFNKLPITYLVQDGNVIQDLGWHFSWMGNGKIRVEKARSFVHYDDKFESLNYVKYNSEKIQNKLLEDIPEEGKFPPSGFKNSILKKYPLENLPKQIFELPRVKNYLLPNFNSEKISFQINKSKKSTVWIVDNFYENPNEVRKFALDQKYIEGGFGRGFIGRRTEQQFLFPELKETFEEIMGKKISKWEEYGMNGRFQIAWSGEPLVWHCDSQTYGGLIYLTPDAPYQCGTTLYAHKKNRARTYYDNGWDEEWSKEGSNHLDGTPWEAVDVLGNVYNRLVIFDGSCIHSASQYFGSEKENARLWQMFFFDV